MLLTGPHSSLLFKICEAYAERGLFCSRYLMCSWYLTSSQQKLILEQNKGEQNPMYQLAFDLQIKVPAGI
jgi:hypothetical protein